MNRHLVTVKISVKSRADQGMNLNGTAIDEHRLKGLNTQSVECGRTIEQDRPLLNDFLKDVIDL